MQNTVSLTLEKASKKYGSLYAVNEISIQLKKGEIFGLLGPNGAGKTTIISMITGLIPLTEGSISIFGKDIIKHPFEAKQSIGCVPQELISIGYFSIEKILQFYSGYYGIWNNRRREEWLLKKLELWSHRKKLMRELSGGMKRRVMIARALLHSPPLVLLDEPTAGVDVNLRVQLLDFVRELNETGTTVLLTTHYLEEAEKLCDRIAILHQGNLIYLGNTHELIQKMTFRKIRISWKEKQKKLHSPYVIQQTDEEAVFKIPSSLSLQQLMNQCALSSDSIRDIQTREGNLEEAFHSFCSRYS